MLLFSSAIAAGILLVRRGRQRTSLGFLDGVVDVGDVPVAGDPAKRDPTDNACSSSVDAPLDVDLVTFGQHLIEQRRQAHLDRTGSNRGGLLV